MSLRSHLLPGGKNPGGLSTGLLTKPKFIVKYSNCCTDQWSKHKWNKHKWVQNNWCTKITCSLIPNKLGIMDTSTY